MNGVIFVGRLKLDAAYPTDNMSAPSTWSNHISSTRTNLASRQTLPERTTAPAIGSRGRLRGAVVGIDTAKSLRDEEISMLQQVRTHLAAGVRKLVKRIEIEARGQLRDDAAVENMMSD